MAPGLVDTFICNCTDCRKITASMFASNFTVLNSHIRRLRGADDLKTFSQSRTIASGNTMTNFVCQTCGTLMYRRSYGHEGKSFMGIGTLDDFHLHETKLSPQVEIFVKGRVGWWGGMEGAEGFVGRV